MSDVPPEIIYDIFRRLPVKSLVRFRRVCKPFCALIDSPDFTKSHLNHSLESNSNRSIIVIKSGKFHSIDFDLLDKAVDLKLPPFENPEVVGSCNGLVCISDINTGATNIHLANPSTGNYGRLPYNAIEYPHLLVPIQISSMVFGFGYDHVNDDYKVVQITVFCDQHDNVFMDVNEVKVYSLKSNTWRKTKDFPHNFYFRKTNGVLVSGALHWIGEVIVSFDIATEEYRLIPLPEHTPCENVYPEMISELGGRLCVWCCVYNHHRYDNYINIWVMNCYGQVDLWTKLCSVAQPYLHGFKYLKALAYSKDGEKLLLEQELGLVWYNLKLGTVENIIIPESPYVLEPYLFTNTPYIYTNSLIMHNIGVLQRNKSSMVEQENKRDTSEKKLEKENDTKENH